MMILELEYGCDYIYCKYTKTNLKEYSKTKNSSEWLNTSNINQTTSNIDAKINNFLELLCNTTGNIPSSIGSEGGFLAKKDDGIVVKYHDIYGGEILAGDLLLDNYALGLFDLLEKRPETQCLVNVFKYMAYLYSGKTHSYGVESAEGLVAIFNLTSSVGMFGDNFEQRVWFALIQAGLSPEATAGVMGNLVAESGIISNNLENTYNTSLGLSDEQYTEKVRNGTYTNFIHDSAGYGLAQWTYYSRKEGLYNYCRDKYDGDISNEEAQINYLLTELGLSNEASGYATPQISSSDTQKLKTTNSVAEATKLIMIKFENPADQSTSAQNGRISNSNTILNANKGLAMPDFSNMGNASFLDVAKRCHAYYEKNNFYYVNGNEIPYPNGTKYTDCSAYVSWVLYEYGYKNEFKGHQKVCTYFINNKSTLQSKYGWVYKPATQAAAGDIIVRSEHMEIYAGNGHYLNCGTTTAIRRTWQNTNWGPGYLSNFTYAITVTKPH